MAEIKTRPATPEFRDGWDRIFRKPARIPESVAEVERLMADVEVGGKVVVRDVSGEELGCIVTADADYNRKLCNALFKVSHTRPPVDAPADISVDKTHRLPMTDAEYEYRTRLARAWNEGIHA